VTEVVSPENIVVVAAADQSLPPLPSEIKIAHDERPERGPLEGLAAGLRALQGKADAVYATGCDVPLLVPAFVERMFELLAGNEVADNEIAIPCDGEFHHPLAAVYRASVLPVVEKLLTADRLSPRALFGEVRTLEVPVEELRSVDPELLTLRNLNRVEDYLAALEAFGFSQLHEGTEG
jgi:molybdopterin-guanine dinucleotide biosynthesis protein A